MARNIRLELADGASVTGTLALPFEPGDKIVALEGEDAAGGIASYPLAEVCCVMLHDAAGHGIASEPADLFEQVEIISGKFFHVRILPARHEKGFFAAPAGDDPLFPLIFFFHHGVRFRKNFQHLGDILARQGALSPADVKQALARQQQLQGRKLGEIIAAHQQLSQETIDTTIRQARQPAGPAAGKLKVGEILVKAKIVSRQQLGKALQEQQIGRGKKIGDILREQGVVDADAVLAALAEKFHMPFVNLAEIIPSETALAALPLKMVQQLKVFPIDNFEDRLVVATSSPLDPGIGDTLRFYIGRRVDLVVAPAGQIAKAIDLYYINKTGNQVHDLIDEMTADDVSLHEESEEAVIDESDSQIIQLVNRVLLDAYKRGVSDIHVEPGSGNTPVIIRYRLDGTCHETHNVPAAYKSAIISRLKIMAHLDISERRRPQSGKILLKYQNKKIEYRLEVTPTVGGNEDAVLRVLTGDQPMAIGEMGFSAANLQAFKEMLTKPHGIILCVGPTGSGKTFTLHAGLGYINTPKRKIWTAEDPVEISQRGLRQVQVHPKIGFTFKEALRSFLRADPDVIMIGEMRDQETARIAVEASLTGHLVLSTLHTNSAPETVVRLIEMGVDPFNFADALLGIIAQRLTRRLCEHCRAPFRPDQLEYDTLVHHYGEELFALYHLDEQFKDGMLMKKVGCERCERIGYQGRIAIHELLVGTRRIKQAIKANATAEALEELAIAEGMNTLRMDGILKVFQGITDLEQILDVCPLQVSSLLSIGAFIRAAPD